MQTWGKSEFTVRVTAKAPSVRACVASRPYLKHRTWQNLQARHRTEPGPYLFDLGVVAKIPVYTRLRHNYRNVPWIYIREVNTIRSGRYGSLTFLFSILFPLSAKCLAFPPTRSITLLAVFRTAAAFYSHRVVL